MNQEPLRWGILGCGFISGDFVRAMDSCEHPNEVHAVAAANSLSRAHEFRNGHFQDEKSKERVTCYGNYGDLLAREDLDVVYVGVANHLHKSTVIQALNAKKHVLCEKPLSVNAKEVREMIEAAHRNKRFLMEAYWSRYFPVWKHIQERGIEEIEGARVVLCDFGINVERVKNTPLEHGGGYLLANGCYAVMFAHFIFGGERPEKVVATGHLDNNDIWANVTMTYSNDRMASVFYHGLQETPCQASVSGRNGYLKLPEFFWSPSLLIKKVGDSDPETLEFPLPDSKHQFFYPNSVGLCYETDHVYECLRDGRLESPITTLDTSLQLAELFDEIRSQIGLRFPQDD